MQEIRKLKCQIQLHSYLLKKAMKSLSNYRNQYPHYRKSNKYKQNRLIKKRQFQFDMIIYGVFLNSAKISIIMYFTINMSIDTNFIKFG